MKVLQTCSLQQDFFGISSSDLLFCSIIPIVSFSYLGLDGSSPAMLSCATFILMHGQSPLDSVGNLINKTIYNRYM